mgnify:CR=1 FL=1
MSDKQLLVITLIFVGFGFAFGHSVGTDQQVKINESLQTEYNELKQNYDILESQYKKDLESCYVQLERYERGSNSE